MRPQDNFFALGGHSLLAVQAHRDIRAELGAKALSITDIFRFPRLDALASHVSDDKGRAPSVTVTDTSERIETMSKRRAMRADRGRARTG